MNINNKTNRGPALYFINFTYTCSKMDNSWSSSCSSSSSVKSYSILVLPVLKAKMVLLTLEQWNCFQHYI